MAGMRCPAVRVLSSVRALGRGRTYILVLEAYLITEQMIAAKRRASAKLTKYHTARTAAIMTSRSTNQRANHKKAISGGPTAVRTINVLKLYRMELLDGLSGF